MPSRVISKDAVKPLASAVRRSSGPTRNSASKLIERRPVAIHAKQALKLLARLFQRPDRRGGDMPRADRHALPLLRIGLEQIVDIGRIKALAGDAQGLGHAAGEDIAAEPLARDQLRGGVAHGAEALQPEGEQLRQLLAARLALVASPPTAAAASI